MLAGSDGRPQAPDAADAAADAADAAADAVDAATVVAADVGQVLPLLVLGAGDGEQQVTAAAATNNF